MHVGGDCLPVGVAAFGLCRAYGQVWAAEAPRDEVADRGAGGGVDLGDAGFGDAEFVGACLPGPAVAVRPLHDLALLVGEAADRGPAPRGERGVPRAFDAGRGLGGDVVGDAGVNGRGPGRGERESVPDPGRGEPGGGGDLLGGRWAAGGGDGDCGVGDTMPVRISNTTLSKIESGDTVRPAILLRVLDTLGLEVRRGPQTSQSELLAPMVVAFIDKYGTDEERDEAAGYLLRMMGQYPGRRTSI